MQRNPPLLLGEGGYGTVLSDGTSRAQKIQKPHRTDRGVSCNVLRELTCLVSINDPRTVPRVYKMGIDETATVKFTMPRFAQTVLDLQRRFPDRVLPMSLTKAILRDVCLALASAHARGIIHRDIKPENVMVRRLSKHDMNDTARVIDWGLARVATTRAPTQWTPNVTTLWYRAPEVLLNEPYNHAIDIWSLGVMAVELLTGRCIFRGSGSVECLRNIIQILGPPPQGVFVRWDEWSRRLNLKTTVVSESSRTKTWTLGSAFRISNVAADFIDRCLRWTPSKRTTAHDALTHPYLATTTESLPTRTSLPFTKLVSTSRPSSIHVSAVSAQYNDSIFFRLVQQLRLLEGVEWTAALLLGRCVQAGIEPTAELAYTCLDVANKLVGTQHCDVLSRTHIKDARAATAILLRDVLGLEYLDLYLSPLHELRQRSAETKLFRYPEAQEKWMWVYAYARAFVDVVLVVPPLGPRHLIPSPDVLARTAWTMATFVTGAVRIDGPRENDGTVYHGSKCAVSCICRAWLVVTTERRSEKAVHWKRLHARVLSDQSRDEERQKRFLDLASAAARK